MPSPFPGMDPYLEHPNLWPDVHTGLINEIRYALTPLLAPRYTARLDVHVMVDHVTNPDEIAVIVPDVAVLQSPYAPAESYTAAATAIAPAPFQTVNALTIPVRQATLEIRTAADGRLVTVIELLSPVNKRPTDDRYRYKRERLLDRGVHLLEIDLLRSGRRIRLLYPPPEAPYYVLLSRGNRRPRCEVWPLPLAGPLPVIPVPLLGDDPDVPLDLGGALATVYDRARYDLSVNYAADPFPPLSAEDAAWADSLLREKGLRPDRPVRTAP